MGKGATTRARIMDIAETAVLQKGFGATSIEELIAAAGITKSGFFYHFRDKNALAHGLLQRHLANDEAILNDIFGRAGKLSDDPLQAFLIGLQMLAEMMHDLPGGHPGCLVVTYCYNERLFDQATRDLNRQAVLAWRRRFTVMFRDINERHVPREPVDTDALADMVSSVVEGGIVVSKVLKEPQVLAQQILLLRSYVRLLYQPLDHPQPARARMAQPTAH
ncbi:MAG: TetR/AcrR family transcriptional regulator [Rhodospirillaceae bacterium]|nr:TetR/AcrR family transcriptional regulator [Rhodospirillaceae bacterium]